MSKTRRKEKLTSSKIEEEVKGWPPIEKALLASPRQADIADRSRFDVDGNTRARTQAWSPKCAKCGRHHEPF